MSTRLLAAADLLARRGGRGPAVLLVALVLLAAGAVQGTPRPAAPSGVAAVTDQAVAGPVPVPMPVPRRAGAARAVPAAPAPRVPHRAHHPAAAVPAARYLPTGTGMWIHEWAATEGGDAGRVVRRARAAGLTHLYVQTGSTTMGWVGDRVLSELLPATRGTGLSVIAWDFPKLLDPEADARRLARAARWQRPGSPRVAAVAPDIETLAEGTHASVDSIERYYRTLRAALPTRVAIIATVPWPSEKRLTRYPYTRTALHADAFAPMAYWYNRSPAEVTAISMRVLRPLGRPVLPVGQGYDGRLDAPYLAADPAPGRSVDAFVRAARAAGAPAVSLWSWQTAGPQQWSALRRAGGGAGAGAAPPLPDPALAVAPRT